MYDCANLEDYLGKFGSLLGRQASRSLKPLHTPRTDRPLDVSLLRKPFEAQAHVVTAAVKVPLAKREAWIERHGGQVDVVISHPLLVETGLDLFSRKPGGHNFATLVFYETGYNLFTLRQASRRAWRIGQRQDCRVYYLYYDATMQARAMNLMGRKLAAAQAVEGKFSSAGLVAMAGEDGGSVEMQLAKSLAERLDDVDASREWEKVAVVEQASESLSLGRDNGSATEPTDDALAWLDSDEFAALFGTAA